ncbi:MAG: T9SS type A sorting domain-containing protein [Taibaiella sp.]|nr:T9SS type A sorting domain-containing protein [Taibaiella sp.]
MNISWNQQVTGKADVTITYITGREVYQSTMDINVASGSTAVSLPVLSNGVYFVKIKSAAINYSNKLTIQH